MTPLDDWHRLSAKDALSRTGGALSGLTSEEAERRLAEHGPNELVQAGVKSPWRILLEQFTSVLIVILIVAAIASLALGDHEDAIAIFAIVILNGLLGFRQEYKAEKTMNALRKLAAPLVRVSAVSMEGVDELRTVITDLLIGDAAASELWISNERHASALRVVSQRIADAIDAPHDVAALELLEALNALAAVTGRDGVGEETLASIFANFCVGK